MNQLLPYLSLALFALTSLGGVLAFRYSIAKTSSEIQERVINALKGEIDTLKDKIAGLEKENMKLQQTLGLIKSALRKRGLTVSIEGDLVTIGDTSGHITHTARITGQERS
jgi:cell division protein FtsB